MIKKLISVLSVLLLVVSTSGAFVVSAQDQKSSKEVKTLEQTGLTPQAYAADTQLGLGTVVQVDEKTAGKVKPATQDKLDKLLGVVSTTNNLPITFNAPADGQVYVSTNGRHDALVTSENGPIAAGDTLTVSSLSGTLMKSSVDQKIVFGKALASFDGKNNAIGTTSLKTKDGKTLKQVGIGLIPVSIEIMKNPEDKSTKTNVPDFLERIGLAIAEKPISPIRIYISVAVVVMSIVLALALLYAGVRNSIISIGRNPLSKKSIFRGLLQVTLTSVLVLIIGLFAVYLILRL